MSDLDEIYKIPQYNIYIGAYWPRINFDKLKRVGITSIINLMEESFYDPRSEGFIYLHEGFPDNKQVSHKIIQKLLDFMDLHLRNGGKIFLHCSMGLSRSPSIVIAWLLKENPEWTWNDAFFYINKIKKIYPAVEIKQSILEYFEALEGYRRDLKNI